MGDSRHFLFCQLVVCRKHFPSFAKFFFQGAAPPPGGTLAIFLRNSIGGLPEAFPLLCQILFPGGRPHQGELRPFFFELNWWSVGSISFPLPIFFFQGEGLLGGTLAIFFKSIGGLSEAFPLLCQFFFQGEGPPRGNSRHFF